MINENYNFFLSIISYYMVLEHGFQFALGKANFVFDNFQKNPRGPL